MNTEAYDAQTTALIHHMLELQRETSPDIFKVLAKLKKTAVELDDKALLGFVHFHTADAYYALEIDYSKFIRHLGYAITCLQEAGDKELLARTYNYVGIDAMNNGSFDVAYHYFSVARNTLEGCDNRYLESIVNDNIGQVYARLGQPKKAIPYVRKSNRLQRLADATDFYYYQNLVSGYFSEGVLSIELGDLAGAKRMEQKIDAVAAKLEGDLPAGVRIPVSFLKLRIAILMRDDALYEQRLGEMQTQIKSAHRLFDYFTDIQDLCMFLLDHDKTEPVRMILDEFGDKIETTGVVNMMKYISAIEIAYYEKTGDEKKVLECLNELDALSNQRESEQNRIYRYSIDLIRSMDELRKQQEKVTSEHEVLRVQATTDALCGIANRLMMNRYLSEVFETAFKEKQTFGVEILDVDYFKEYNDTYGHQAGDECLRRIADVINRISLENGLYCARYGGDEFVIICRDLTDEEFLAVAKELDRRVRALAIIHAASHKESVVSVSQGICNSVPNKKTKSYDYLSVADNALYAVKKSRASGGTGNKALLYHLPLPGSGGF